jgi:hypothetical protein
VDGRDLAAQVVGHGAALRLVFGVERIAKGGALGVEHAGRVGAGNVLERFCIMLMMMRMAPVFCTVPSGRVVLMVSPPAKKAR